MTPPDLAGQAWGRARANGASGGPLLPSLLSSLSSSSSVIIIIIIIIINNASIIIIIIVIIIIVIVIIFIIIVIIIIIIIMGPRGGVEAPGRGPREEARLCRGPAPPPGRYLRADRLRRETVAVLGGPAARHCPSPAGKNSD